MKLVVALILLMFAVSAFANPYDGRMSMFENGKEVSKSYHQMAQKTSEEGLLPLAKLIHKQALAIFSQLSKVIQVVYRNISPEKI